MSSNVEILSEPKTGTGLSHLLFYTRILLYMLAFAIPVVHPAVVVPYDKLGWWLWFGVLPAEMLIAFYAAPPRLSVRAWFALAAAPVVATILFISGLSLYSFAFLGVGLASFLLTAAIFHGGPWGRWLALPEPFLLSILYYKMLSFTRASEAIASASQGVTQLLLVVSIGAFLLHVLVLYLAAFRLRRSERGRRELIVFAAVALPVVLAVALLLPPNFVTHNIVLNSINQRVKPKPVPVDATGKGLPGGNLRSPLNQKDAGQKGIQPGQSYLYGDGYEQGPAQGNQPALEGVPSNQWQNGQTGGSGEGRQYAVMVVASPVDPVYAADGYFGRFDPVAGFERSPDQPLNDLVHQHLLETWTDPNPPNDLDRSPESIFYLSTIPDRVLAYRPSSVEPTVLQRQYFPFNYSYGSVSMMSDAAPQQWSSIDGLSASERRALAPYLQIPLSPSDRAIFESYLKGAVGDTTGYFARIMDILRSFSKYQYRIGFTDDVSIAHLVDFLTTTKNGDCVEFSNTTAVLARLAGIPARVVTGYLASRDLQTLAHRRGLAVLREKIPLLQKFPMNELYLVTTAHRHSWVQLYMPGYGWVDFETTSYAIPPASGGDPNSWNVVIPLLEGQKELSPFAAFPWALAGEIAALLAASSIALLYLYRYGRELFYLYVSRGRNRRALDALYKLLLLRLVAGGYELKKPALTASEYAAIYPELSSFASRFTELKYRERFGKGEREALWAGLKREYRDTISRCRKRGFGVGVRRLVSLKGLSYRW